MTWQRALESWGRFGLATDLGPAEHVARQGFPVTDTLREETRENAFRFDQFSSTSALFLPGGQLPAVGSPLRDPALADTYALIGRRGIGAFYGGAIGRDIVDTVHHLPLAPGATLVPRPGQMALSDLRRYRAPLRPPTHVGYRGYDVYSMAPSSSGGSTVGESLNILGNFAISHESAVQQWHHYLEATRLAFADRNRYVGDPGFVNVPLRGLLSPGFGRQRACLIDPAHALTSPVAPGNPFAGSGGCTPTQPTNAALPTDGASTNHFVVADRYGDVVSYTNTIEELGGGGIVVPGRGFLLNNELTDFDFTPLQSGVPDPNLPAAGKRPRSSMSPTIVLRNGRPFLAVGAAGRRDDHHHGARDPRQPDRPPDAAARGDRRPAGLAAQRIDDDGRAGVPRAAGRLGPEGARAVVRAQRHLAARLLDLDPAHRRRGHRPRAARPRPLPRRRRAGSTGWGRGGRAAARTRSLAPRASVVSRCGCATRWPARDPVARRRCRRRG